MIEPGPAARRAFDSVWHSLVAGR